MPKGPKGEKRPADVIGAAVKVAKIATGEFEYAHVAFEAGHGSGLADRRPGRPCPQNRQCRLKVDSIH